MIASGNCMLHGPGKCTRCCQHANALHDSPWGFALALNNIIMTSAELGIYGSELEKSDASVH